MVFRKAERVAATTARVAPEVPLELAAHRAKVVQLARLVVRAAMRALEDGSAARAVNPREAAAPREPEVHPAREALPQAVVPLALVVAQLRVALQAKTAAPEREA